MKKAFMTQVPGYVSHYEAICTEQGGRQILGPHLTFDLSVGRLTKDDKRDWLLVLRKFFHPSCEIHSVHRVYGQSGSVRLQMEVTF